MSTLDVLPRSVGTNDAGQRRQSLFYVDTELPHLVSAASKILVQTGAEVFARGTSLFRPVRIDRPVSVGGVSRLENSTVLVPIDKASLAELLTVAIDWRKYDSRLKNDPWKPVSCPSIIAETLLSRRGDWPFPQLRAIITAPTLRPDGSLLAKPGFDRATGILLRSEFTWPAIPDKPSFQNARDAASILGRLIETFPFAGRADRSAALAMILTAIVRPCLPTAPLFGVSAPTPGTGKSKLVDLAAVLATGTAAAVLSAPREEAELQKHVGSVLMAGDSFVSLDNIEHPLRSEFLCQVLTQEAVAVRVLGESRTLKLPTGATFCATGNSLRFAGDLVRRVVMVHLDANMERPEERVFKCDAVVIAKASRIDLVMAALTVLRAFIVAGAPKIMPPLGGFEDWSNLVRSALVWIGEADPLENASRVRDADPERERTATILNSLPAGDRWTVASIAARLHEDRSRTWTAKEYEPLADALSEFMEHGVLNRVRFGKFLHKHAGRIIDGKRITSCGHDRNKVALWEVEQCGGCGESRELF